MTDQPTTPAATSSNLVNRLRIHLQGDHVQRINLDNEAADRIEQLERVAREGKS